MQAISAPRVAPVAAPRTVAARAAAPARNVASTAACAALVASLVLGAPQPAAADVAGLTKCSESKAFAKRNKQEVKGLKKRMKNYAAGSAPAVALQATIDKTDARFAKYAAQGVLCGDDGLPHLIADPGLALRYGHAGDVWWPTLGFVYVAGLIGSAGRSYLRQTQSIAKEYIIDVPLALRCSARGLVWPVDTVKEWRRNDLLADEADITVSPR